MGVLEPLRSYPILAGAASFWQPGLGQILLGRFRRGIVIVLLSLPALGVYLNFLFLVATQTTLIMSTVVFVFLLDMGVRIWSLYDAYTIAINSSETKKGDNAEKELI